jgi:hypothetical protein
MENWVISLNKDLKEAVWAKARTHGYYTRNERVAYVREMIREAVKRK